MPALGVLGLQPIADHEGPMRDRLVARYAEPPPERAGLEYGEGGWIGMLHDDEPALTAEVSLRKSRGAGRFCCCAA